MVTPALDLQKLAMPSSLPSYHIDPILTVFHLTWVHIINNVPGVEVAESFKLTKRDHLKVRLR